jgi:hypothetical protein
MTPKIIWYQQGRAEHFTTTQFYLKIFVGITPYIPAKWGKYLHLFSTCILSPQLYYRTSWSHMFTSNNGYAYKNSKGVQQEDKGVLITENAYEI